MNNCIIDVQGKLIHPEVNRELLEGEFEVSLNGYYEILNEQKYPNAIYNLKSKKWVGVGEQIKEIKPPITEEQKAMDLLKVIAMNIMNNDELLKVVGIEPRPTV